jgi:MYXO-CTERM domain-containing protein
MKSRVLVASSLALSALCLSPARALAQVFEPNNVQYPPNGLQVPLNGNNGEEELNTFFAAQGETIDWINDAHTTPNSFSPLCGFTATFALNQAGSKFGLAWYNDTGTAPTAADLHEIVPAGTPVGSMVAGATILSDPNYKGGQVGFALEVPPSEGNHYTNQAYNTVCSDTSVCNPAGPWVLALMYASTKTPNAYYICFEDGSTSADGWGNDGDFNDDVFFITGITCQGGGQPCDTGKPGICEQGLTQCSANGTTCQQLNQPTTETCNGLDDDCNGMVDDGAICPTGEVCQMGTCVQSCQGGEFPCPAGKVCQKDGYCVDPACANVTCPSGQVCEQGTCKGPCDGVTCPYPTTCRVGACVDPCMGVTCPSSQVCSQGVCIASCQCQPCATNTACDMTSGQCVDPTCVSVTCGAGTHCVAGTCQDDCMGAVCPTGQVCMAGACVVPASSATSSSSGVSFAGVGGSGSGTGSANGGASNGAGSAAGGASAGGANGSGASTFGTGGSGAGSSGSKSKCGCEVPGDGGAASGSLALVGLALAVASSRRRRRA